MSTIRLNSWSRRRTNLLIRKLGWWWDHNKLRKWKFRGGNKPSECFRKLWQSIKESLMVDSFTKVLSLFGTLVFHFFVHNIGNQLQKFLKFLVNCLNKLTALIMISGLKCIWNLLKYTLGMKKCSLKWKAISGRLWNLIILFQVQKCLISFNQPRILLYTIDLWKSIWLVLEKRFCWRIYKPTTELSLTMLSTTSGQ